jgi:hypothetical protein|tara:strand:- start:21253 stop:21495 length:243 start_codon:yes stop_codon:yes gene_type:complete
MDLVSPFSPCHVELTGAQISARADRSAFPIVLIRIRIAFITWLTLFHGSAALRHHQQHFSDRNDPCVGQRRLVSYVTVSR